MCKRIRERYQFLKRRINYKLDREYVIRHIENNDLSDFTTTELLIILCWKIRDLFVKEK